nr:hypothetical protein [Candidatus Sigynarchaeota archaeon]
MTVIEMVISCDGFPLYKRKFINIRAIDDDDVIAPALYSVFYRIEKSIIPGDSGENVLKLDMGHHHMHALKTKINPSGTGKSRELYIYIIEDRNIEKAVAATILKKLLDAFLKRYQEKIEKLLKASEILQDFDEIVDQILGNMAQKQYKRFFDVWNAPRMRFP